MNQQIIFSINTTMFKALSKRAEEHGYKPTAYAKMLFEAAFACRVGVTQDPGIDDRIALAVVLQAARHDTATIAKRVGLSEATVTKIISAWHDEMRAA